MGECQCRRRETGRKIKGIPFLCTFVVSWVSLTFLSDLSYIVSAFFGGSVGLVYTPCLFFFFRYRFLINSIHYCFL